MAAAASKKPAAHSASASRAGPRPIGKFDDWIAATHPESRPDRVLCLHARAKLDTALAGPRLGGPDGDPTRIRTRCGRHRSWLPIRRQCHCHASGRSDRAGFLHLRAQRVRSRRPCGGHRVRKGSRAIARSPAPKEVTDTFSLRGFAQAYAAIGEGMPGEMNESFRSRPRADPREIGDVRSAGRGPDGRAARPGRHVARELAAELAAIGEAPFRVKQLWHWIYHQGVTDFARMSTIARPLQQKLAERFIIGRPEAAGVQTSVGRDAQIAVPVPRRAGGGNRLHP